MKRLLTVDALLLIVSLGAAAPLVAQGETRSRPERPSQALPNAPQVGQGVRPEQIQDVPALEMDLPPSPRPWDTSDDALIARVRQDSGQVAVAFRSQGQPSTLAGAGRPAPNGKGRRGVRGAIGAASIRAGLQFLESRQVEILYYSPAGYAVVRIDPARLAEVIPELRRHPLIDYVEPLQPREPVGVVVSPVPAPVQQVTHWGISLIRAPTAWAKTGGENAGFVVVDFGHDDGHPDLFTLNATQCAGIDAGRCYDGELKHWHGTRMMGVITASDNGLGTVGVAPRVPLGSIISYRACRPQVGDCPPGWIRAGIDYAGQIRTRAVNVSLSSGPYDATEANSVALAWSRGVVIVAAAGNLATDPAGTVVYPAGYTNVIGVSGVRQDGSFATQGPCTEVPYSGSNYGTHVDLSAPIEALTTYGTGRYMHSCSTSTATAYVTGAAVLVASANPTWTNQQIVDRLIATANRSRIPTAGRNQYYGWGTVDVGKAVTGQ
jgi:hypothetical protein